MPLAAHGVGTDAAAHVAARDPRVDLGQRAAGCARPGRAAARTPRCRRTSWRTRGTTKPPRPSPPKTTSGAGGGLGQRGRRGGDPADVDAVEGRDLLGDPGRGDRQRDRAARALGGDQVEHDEQRPLVVDQRAPSRRRGRCRSPTGSKRTPNAALRRRRPADRAGAAPRARSAAVSVGDASSRPLLTVSTSTPSRPSRVGSTSEAVPPAVSTTTLRPASAHAAACRRGAAARGRRPPSTRGGKDRSPISPGNARRNSRGQKIRSSLRCAAWRQVGAAARRGTTMSTLSGCPGVVRITTPPARRPARSASRATGTGTTSRSTTSIALDVERAR